MRRPFNVETMSGVYSGTRAAVFRHIRARVNAPVGEAIPLLLQWYTEPASVRILKEGGETQPSPAPSEAGAAPETQVLGAVQLAASPESTLADLDTTLENLDLQPECCYTCRHWSPYISVTPGQREIDTVPEQEASQSVDGLPDGQCGWSHDAEPRAPRADAELRRQSALSPACSEFAPRSRRGTLPPAVPPPNSSTELRPRQGEDTAWPRRIWQRLRNWGKEPPHEASQNPLDRLVERSGVGAGTEPCFYCQGRLANLGALAVQSEEGDKQTLSVWRCRRCRTLYLNDWTDRWERLDSLETEERYTRIAPAEGLAALQIIHGVPGGDHPAQRAERSSQRAQLLAMVQNKPAVSHQVRMGR